ncbi:MAG: BamA/TamA family outer membrane protein [Gammaproteobacteria bacterium]
MPSYAVVEYDVVTETEKAQAINSKKTKLKGTWLPVPIPVSNPTIGTGLQAAILYLHPKTSTDPEVPDATSGIAGMYTDSDSWMLGGFHDGNWNEDLLRYRLAIGTGEFNLDYFGLNEQSPLKDNPIPYTITSNVMFAQLLHRIPSTRDWYLGMRYVYSNSELKFNIFDATELPPNANANNLTTSGLGIISNYDSRDNNYYPTSGDYFEIVLSRDSDSWGSDFEFDKLSSFYRHYFAITEKDTVALQARYDTVSGNAPFYLLPFLQMRGFAAGKYQSDVTLSGHVEWRHKFHPRWGFVTFYEAGSVSNTASDIFKNETVDSYGVGIRWQVTKDKKLNLGIDVAKSDTDSAVYIKVGESY